MSSGYRTANTQRDYMSTQEKRLIHLERRRQVASAADLLGPGFGPVGTQVLDWNGDVASFNGTFWSEPGALNSPDPAVSWIGQTLTEDNEYGIQQVWAYRDVGTFAIYARQFAFAVSGRQYFPWRVVAQDTGEVTSGVTPLNSSTIDSQVMRARNGVASLTIAVTLGVTIAVGTDGDLINTSLVLLPPEFRPDSARSQPLLSAGTGPVCSFDVTSTGEVRILATTPNAVLAATTTQISVGGTYLL